MRSCPSRRRSLRIHGHRQWHGQEDSAIRFSRPRPSGIIAVGLDTGDYLIGVAITDGRHDGCCSRMPESGALCRARRAAMRRPRCAWDAGSGQRVISLVVAEDESKTVLVATERLRYTPVAEFAPWPRYPGHDRHTDRRAMARCWRREWSTLKRVC